MNIKGIADISGFGKNTNYEKACQDMLQAGFEWLEKHKKAKLKAHTFKDIYGILEPDSKDAKELSKTICEKVPDCSGAMHQCVMGHLMFISANGIDKWKEEVRLRENKKEMGKDIHQEIEEALEKGEEIVKSHDESFRRLLK